MDDFNQAHQDIINQKYYHLGKLCALADKLIIDNKETEANTLKEAIIFFEDYMK